MKSVVAIFRINTLTSELTVGSDVNQVYRQGGGDGGVLDAGVGALVVHGGRHSDLQDIFWCIKTMNMES